MATHIFLTIDTLRAFAARTEEKVVIYVINMMPLFPPLPFVISDGLYWSHCNFSVQTTVSHAFSPVNQMGTSDSFQAQDRPQPPQLSLVFQTLHQPYREVPCGTGSQTTEHLLQSCLLYEPLRKGIWPDYTPVARKLYGSLGDLRCTATFIEETGVSIWWTEEDTLFTSLPHSLPLQPKVVYQYEVLLLSSKILTDWC